MSKLILFFVVVCLIALVLFLSYKMDKNEVSKKRKEKIIKNNKNNDIDEKIYRDIYDMVKESLLVDEDEKNDISKLNQDTMQIDINEIKETIENDSSLEDKILSDYLEICDEPDLNIYENALVENIINDELVDEIDYNKTEEFKTENNKEIEVENVEESEIDETRIDEESEDEVEEIYYNDSDENLNEFTMIFNSKLLKSTEEILEDDEDSELKDLENEIAVANIKKYTRNKKGLPKLVSKKANPEVSRKTNNKVKRYTRKKNNDKKKVEGNSTKVRRYTRKKVTNLNKENLELLNRTTSETKETSVKNDKPKLKRGRPKKIDKPKRGRPKKVEVAKRGRPKKEEKPKRGRPKKTETTSKSKKTNTTNKK